MIKEGYAFRMKLGVELPPKLNNSEYSKHHLDSCVHKLNVFGGVIAKYGVYCTIHQFSLMEDQTTNQLWKKSEGQSHRLRRPRDNSNVTLPNGPAKEVNNTVNKFSGSKLSADAKEFFPAGYRNAAAPASSSKTSAQERLMRIKHNQPQNQNEQCQRNEAGGSHPDGSQEDQDKRRLENMITTLSFNPGQYDDLLPLFVETFKPYLDNHEMINTVAEMLFFEVIAVNYFEKLCLICWFVCFVEH